MGLATLFVFRRGLPHVGWVVGYLLLLWLLFAVLSELEATPLSPVRGGRADGFRTWSRRSDLHPPLAGRYRVDVVTASGQLIGRLRFTITP